jgi:hypothetical protein
MILLRRVPIELSKLHVRSDFAGINERIMSIPGVVATAGNVEFEVSSPRAPRSHCPSVVPDP